MAINIECPHCGTRPIGEFNYGEIPQVPDSLTDLDARDVDRAFHLSNTEGETAEAWFHVYGCRRWLKIRRDTKTDLILD